MTYDVFIVDGDVFDPDNIMGSIKIEDLPQSELLFLADLVCRHVSRDLDLVIRAKKGLKSEEIR